MESGGIMLAKNDTGGTDMSCSELPLLIQGSEECMELRRVCAAWYGRAIDWCSYRWVHVGGMNDCRELMVAVELDVELLVILCNAENELSKR